MLAFTCEGNRQVHCTVHTRGHWPAPIRGQQPKGEIQAVQGERKRWAMGIGGRFCLNFFVFSFSCPFFLLQISSFSSGRPAYCCFLFSFPPVPPSLFSFLSPMRSRHHSPPEKEREGGGGREGGRRDTTDDFGREEIAGNSPSSDVFFSRRADEIYLSPVPQMIASF